MMIKKKTKKLSIDWMDFKAAMNGLLWAEGINLKDLQHEASAFFLAWMS